jgi:hypothetical protein
MENLKKYFPEIDFPEARLDDVYFGKIGEPVIVPNKKVLYDGKTNHSWDIVSDNYGLITHEEVCTNVLEALNLLQKEFPKQYETHTNVSLWKQKAVCVVEVCFCNVSHEIYGNNVQPIIRLYSSYDRSVSFRMDTGAVLTHPEGDWEHVLIFPEAWASGLNMKHVKGNLKIAPEIELKIKKHLQGFEKNIKKWEKWGTLTIPSNFFFVRKKELPFTTKERELMQVTPLESKEETLFQSIKHPSLWDVFLMCSQFANTIKSEQRQLDIRRQLAVVMEDWGGVLV